MLSTNRIHILIDVIIVDLVQTNLILQDDYDNGDLSKRRTYHNLYSTDAFFSLS